MPTVTDTFPAPSIDTTKWTSATTGSTSLVVGTPSDGVYPQTVGDDGDSVIISSSGKSSVPGSTSFEVEVSYEDVFTDPDEVIVSFLGWRSDLLDASGDAAYGIDVALVVSPGPTYEFHRGVINLGTASRDVLEIDASSGGDGGLRITRSGSDYLLYRYDSGTTSWVLLDTVSLPHVGTGYILVGQFAETPTFPFPWITAV